MDDTEVLKKELASVQRLMDDLATAKERELTDLQKQLEDLQSDHEALKNRRNSSSEIIADVQPLVGKSIAVLVVM
jgi:prefoldin subunit 5